MLQMDADFISDLTFKRVFPFPTATCFRVCSRRSRGSFMNNTLLLHNQLLFWDSCTGQKSLPAAKTHSLSRTHRNASNYAPARLQETVSALHACAVLNVKCMSTCTVCVREPVCVSACVRQTPPLRHPLFSHLLASLVGTYDSNLNESLFLTLSHRPSRAEALHPTESTFLCT